MNNKILSLIIGVLVVTLGLGLGYRFLSQRQPAVQEEPVTESEVVESEVNEQIPADSGYIDVSPQKASDLIEQIPDLVIIDVSPHYDKGHLPGAINYYLGDGSLDEALPTLDKSKTYLVYCHVDSVSIAGAQKLVDAGFSKVYRLEGNYSAWVDAGFPVETPSQ